MIVPAASDLTAASRIDFEALDMTDAMVQDEVDALAPWLEDATGRRFDGSAVPEYEPIPPRDDARFKKALRMALEWEAYKQHPDQVESVIDFGEVQAFTAGSYNEDRRGAQDLRYMDDWLHPWPALNKLLQSIQSASRRPQHEVPAVGVSDPRVRGGSEIMGALRGGPRYDPFDMRPRAIVVRRPGTWLPDEAMPTDRPITGLPNG